MKFIKKYKIPLIIVLVCLVLIILAGIAFYKMFYPSGDSEYEDRTKNAVAIDEAVIAKIKDELTDNGAETVNYHTNVKTMKFFIEIDSDNDKVTSLTNIIDENLSEKVKKDYDIAIYFTNPDDKNFIVNAYKGKNVDEFSITFNKEVEENEE